MGRGKIGSEEEETEDETEGQRADRAGLTRQAGLGPELGGVRRFRASCGFSWQAERSSTSALPGVRGPQTLHFRVRGPQPLHFRVWAED